MPDVASRKNIWILSFTLLVVMLGYGMIQPIIPFLMRLEATPVAITAGMPYSRATMEL